MRSADFAQEVDLDYAYHERFQGDLQVPPEYEDYATVGDLMELKTWCNRLAVMVQRCCQPNKDWEDVGFVLQDFRISIEKLENNIEEIKVQINEEFHNIMQRINELPEKVFQERSDSRETPSKSVSSGQSNEVRDVFKKPGAPAGAMKGSRGSGNNRIEQGGIRFDLSRGRSASRSTSGLLADEDVAEDDAEEHPNLLQRTRNPLHRDADDDDDDTKVIRLEFAEDEEFPCKAEVTNGSGSFDEERLKKVEERVKALFEENEAKKRSTQHSHLSFEVFHITHDDGDLEYEFSSSIWDASMVMFFRSDGGIKTGSFTDKLAILITYLGNLFMQLTLIISIYLGMLETPFPPFVLAEMGRWRESQMNETILRYWSNGTIRNTNNAELLCENKLWSWEQSVFNDVYEYTQPQFNTERSTIPGTWLGFLCTAVWVCCIFRDYEYWVIMLRGIFSMPTSSRSILGQNTDDEDVSHPSQIQSASFFTKVSLIGTVIIPRFFVMCSLLYVGCKWISQTHYFEDIIINCVALMFVLDMDETLYVVLLPVQCRKAVENIKPVPLARITVLGGVEIADFIRWILMAMVLAGCYYIFLDPFFWILHDVTSTLCPDGGMYELDSSSAESSLGSGGRSR